MCVKLLFAAATSNKGNSVCNEGCFGAVVVGIYQTVSQGEFVQFGIKG